MPLVKNTPDRNPDMNTKYKLAHVPGVAKKASLLGFLSMIAFSSAASGAVIVPVTYDFGTALGKTTFGDAGFTAIDPGTSQITNVANGVLFERTDKTGGSFTNIGMLRTFTGLGGGETNNFTVATSFAITAGLASPNNERHGGIHLFAPTADEAGINAAGISLQISGLTGDDNDAARIRTGVNGTVIISKDLGYDIAVDDVFDLAATGTYSGTTLTLVFSITRNGGTAQTITRNFNTIDDSALLSNTYFGVSGRYKNDTEATFDTFSVIPEPSSAILAGLFGVGLLVRRRRGPGASIEAR